MKKLLFMISAGMLTLSSCSDKEESDDMSAKAKKNLESHRAEQTCSRQRF